MPERLSDQTGTDAVSAGASRRSIVYREMLGRVSAGEPAKPGTDLVVLSEFYRWSATSSPANAACIRYVARGREDYRIGDSRSRLEPGQLMIASQSLGCEVDIRSTAPKGTFGLCVLLHDLPDEDPWDWGPLVLGANCTAIGMYMEKAVRALSASPEARADIASKLGAALRSEMPAMRHKVLCQSAAIDAAKPATRFEMIRRASLAQAYLHAVSDRIVPLDELARAASTSAFHLLRAFQRAFGESPACYHRKLRIRQALAEAERRKVPIAAVATEFAFAGPSGFSHAYRRAFGSSLRSSEPS